MKKKKTKVLMYSGGMDSWIINKLVNPDKKVFVDFHTKSSTAERKLLDKDVIIKDIDLSEFEVQDEHKLLPLRNLILCIIGSYYGDEVYLGSVGNSHHFDNDTYFSKKAQRLLNHLYKEVNKKVKIKLPYCNTSKTELVKEYKDKGFSLEEAYKGSFSCYTPKNGVECGECPSCKQKIEAFKNNGYKKD